MEQAKKRDHKIFITDVAINKITKSNITVLSSEQNAMIDEIHKELLRISKNDNNSNEVACLFGLYSFDKHFQTGTEHAVNIFDNPAAYSLAGNSENNSLFLAHNHPSTQSFSYADIGVFLSIDSLAGMSVVSNTGDVHILFKTEHYNFNFAYDALAGIKKKTGSYTPENDMIYVKEFLKISRKLGIIQL